MLKRRGADVHHVSPMTKAMTSYAANRDLKRDSSVSHIAEMMIKGNTMGVNKMARHMREYDGSDPHINDARQKDAGYRRRKHRRA